MMGRVWHGWTNRENADADEELLGTEIFPGIAERSTQGYHSMDLLCRDVDDGVEFVTILWFDSLDTVRAFAGEDYEVGVVPPKARQLLSRFDDRSTHYHVIESPD